MPLTEKEAQLISGLPNDPAYILLLEKIQLIIDNLADKLHIADTQLTNEILPLWRALRTVYLELKNTPQDVVNWLDTLSNADVTPLPTNVKTNEQLQKFMQQLEKQRDIYQDPETIEGIYGVTKPNATSYGNII